MYYKLYITLPGSCPLQRRITFSVCNVETRKTRFFVSRPQQLKTERPEFASPVHNVFQAARFLRDYSIVVDGDLPLFFATRVNFAIPALFDTGEQRSHALTNDDSRDRERNVKTTTRIFRCADG